MKLRTYEMLTALRDKFGASGFGKIAQKLLALAFRAAGAIRVVERGVQGVDIDVEFAQSRYTVEVKTTEKTEFQFDDGNINALKERADAGYIPSVAVLRLAPFEDWLLAAPPLSEIRPGSCLVDRYRAYRLRSLEASVRPAFEKVMLEEFHPTMQSGQQHLDEKLRGAAGTYASILAGA
jgi:hypothetical protein